MLADGPDLILIQTGTPPDEIRIPLGDLPDWYCHALGRATDSIEVVRVFDGDGLPKPDPSRIAVITGSWSMVTDREPWSEATAAWIRDAMALEMPLFGVCYGHQLMAHALGGRVEYHPQGREIGCHTIRLLPDAPVDVLLSGLPQQFQAHLTHMQTIIDLPPGAYSLAASDHDPHQIVRFGPRAISAQFHPEFTSETSSAIIKFRADALRQEGKDPDELLDAVREAPEAAGLLRKFVQTNCLRIASTTALRSR
ncbi:MULTISPECIES: glutamine amidotransferase [Rhizobium]|jgi:GMP synthase (glutamine-hydrolysing)|uniref:GMP synthase (Glutamine-hydrolysing) n=1 Tax=Rhizobium lusitanum TaxID=293958 RepID=A0A1C3WTC9_9HYPH|nr:glutamine amidotransferase [Rhizobium lusitanum]SCB43211.1 GMP synthase (glutamine-hydrolysing) [Rhizobium lusitanum]